jgi:ubiquitin-like modifier-activating enzyme ATG7
MYPPLIVPLTTKMLASFEDDEPNLNTFLLVAFADLKKYSYHYWFAFPALVSKPAWQIDGAFEPADENVRVAG